MLLELIAIIVIISYVRRSLRDQPELEAKWKKWFVPAIILAVLLMMTDKSHGAAREIAQWLTHILVVYVIYLLLTRKALQTVKTLAYAMLPIVIIYVINDLAKLLFPKFYEDWDQYFETAQVFGTIWMVAMWWIANRQRKTLEKARKAAVEKEKEYAITSALKAQLEVQVAERTAALVEQKNALENTVSELKATQAQLVHSEKMASLGELTAGIAHEIQNPLNFVNNFSDLNAELISEMKAAIEKGDMEEVKAIADDISDNEQKINHHGKRADAIVKGMLQHSRSSSGVKEETDINALADEYLRLAYHGLRAKDKSFNALMKSDFDPAVGKVNAIPQDLGRVILNLITNAFYAVNEKKKSGVQGYEPTVTVSTRKVTNGKGKQAVEIAVKDNGNGIPDSAMDKIFQPFFTTKPTGQGTGLGLSMSYDIVTKGHDGELKVSTKEGEGTIFTVHIPT